MYGVQPPTKHMAEIKAVLKVLEIVKKHGNLFSFYATLLIKRLYSTLLRWNRSGAIENMHGILFFNKIDQREVVLLLEKRMEDV